MNITIEDNQYIYISFFKRQEFGIVEETCPDINCFLLFDELNNWIGLEILNENFDGPIKLPPIETIDFPIYEATITKEDDRIEILFSKEVQVNKKINQDCIIDIVKGQIYGIEILLWSNNNIGNKGVVKPFVSRDI